MVEVNSPASFMALALDEASRAIGRTHPNPPVGAVVVRDGRVIGRGHTLPAGMPHAEVEALRDAGAAAVGADLYVTLEPCSHQGRTPPCTDAVLRAGVRRVFVGVIDPNPLVFGKGVERLRQAGVSVEVGVLEEQCRKLIRAFAKHVTTGLPFVMLKVATTLDGKLATRTGDSKWISGEASRRLVHVWRDEHDAVLVGAGTLRQDDPLLTTRLDAPAVAGRTPRTATRVVVLGSGPIPPAAKLWDVTPGPVLIAMPEERAVSLPEGVTSVPVPSSGGRIDVRALLLSLGGRGITSLMVEGGAATHAAFLRAEMVDEVRLFIAPRISGADGISWVGALGVETMDRAWRLEGMMTERVGGDLLVIGVPRRAKG